MRVIVVILAVMFGAASGCGRVYKIEGIVVDGDGIPIGDASIYLYPHDWERQSFGRANGTSEEDGTFEAGWGSAVGVKFFQMVVSKAGYREHQQLVEADARNVRVVLERLTAAANAGDTIEP